MRIDDPAGEFSVPVVLAEELEPGCEPDALDAPKYGTTVGRDPFSPGLKKGLDYLEKGDNAMHVDGGYSLYG
ncbi:MAG TPA: hypothetical protein VK986_05625, partial [Tepidisphaeraceae bacterium]|nr:hypothetical protein [Tepidisphaeraceae bacterium]